MLVSQTQRTLFHFSGQCLHHIWTSGRLVLHFVYSIMFQPSLRLTAMWCVWLMSHIFRPTVTLVWTLIQDKRTHSECALPEWGFFCLVCAVRINKRNLRTPDYCEVSKTLARMSTTWPNVDFVNIHWMRMQSIQNFLQSEKCEQGPNRAEHQVDKTSDINSAASEDRIQNDSCLLFSTFLKPSEKAVRRMPPPALNYYSGVSLHTWTGDLNLSNLSIEILVLRSSIKNFPQKNYNLKIRNLKTVDLMWPHEIPQLYSRYVISCEFRKVNVITLLIVMLVSSQPNNGLILYWTGLKCCLKIEKSRRSFATCI